MLLSLLAAGLVPELHSWDTRALNRCCRYTWELAERSRIRELGVRQGWLVAIPILRELDLFCVVHRIDDTIEAQWRRQVIAVLGRRALLCEQLRLAVPRH